MALYCIDTSSLVDDSENDLEKMAFRTVKLPSNIRSMQFADQRISDEAISRPDADSDDENSKKLLAPQLELLLFTAQGGMYSLFPVLPP